MTTPRRVICGLAFLAVVVYITIFCRIMRVGMYNVWAPLLIVPVMFLATLPVARREARRQGDQGLVGLLLGAMALKMVAALVRYVVTFDVYSQGDAKTYHDGGVTLARLFRKGIFHADVGGKVVGTNFLKIVTGAFYTVTGPTKLGGFFVFAWMAYWGLFLLYKAFQTALPDADHRRYALLLFFLPSLLFWPSSIGKDSWMLFGIGVASLGAARLYVQRPGGFVLVATGVAALGAVRPHVALLLLVPLFAGFIVRRSRSEEVLSRTGTKVFGVIVFLVGGSVVVANAASFLGVDSFNTDTVNQVLNSTQGRTTGGGSEFSAPNAQSPTGFPVAVVTVLFRPFPTEAHTVGSAMAAVEGVFLMGLFVFSWRRLRSLPRVLFREPYLLFCLVYIFLFVFAFSSFGNFGILARERVQVFPFVLALVSVNARSRLAPGPPLPGVVRADLGARQPVATVTGTAPLAG